MKLIEPSFSEIDASDPIARIAVCAHNCYQVEKDGDPSAFISRLAGFNHLAMFEHSRFILEADEPLFAKYRLLDNPFINAYEGQKDGREIRLLSFSYRPLLEEKEKYSDLIALLPASNGFLFEDKCLGKGRFLTKDEILALDEGLKDKFLYISLKIITDRGVTHELVRHRLASYAQESTRYCNYSKNKFGNELTFIEPMDYEAHKDLYDKAFKESEDNYFALLNEGSTPEMARAVLPNKLKASIIITANVEEYKRIFALRCDERAHPDMRQIMIPIRGYFKKEGYISHD